MAGSRPPLRLSVCIATYNRAAFIAETLESILGQMTGEADVIVVDGASSDNTQEVVARVAARYPALRYYREKVNSGVDGDYDKAVGYAAGEYCWLMTDDDVLVPDAVKRVLAALDGRTDLVVVNSEVRNADLTVKLVSPRLGVYEDLEYGKDRREDFFAGTATYLSFIGAVVVRREFWLARERKPYYGTQFIHVGVLFQKPAVGAVKVIARPLIRIRNGNAMWTPRAFEIWAFKWASLLWSFADFPESTRRSVCPREPWRGFNFLLFHRALGSYSIEAFRKHLAGIARGRAWAVAWLVACCPAALANLAVVVYFGLFKRSARVELYDALRSRHASPASRLAARALGVDLR
ncbi:MAG TPA: glycosyltransferase family 2 protein [Burkholderiales bacterium]|nr:glycosyltransferase family 2 protein [Burkholderiales bacterium]